MTVTISTHFGRTVARQHNLRNARVTSKEEHIDPCGHHETWLDVAPREAYKRIFGKALEEYNARQTRADRRIGDYYTHICKDSKKAPVYECIAGVYAKDGTLSAEEQKSMLYEYVKGWQKANPHMALIGAYFHADEAHPHVHIDFIPVANGYKRGMTLQTAEIKAIEQQGFHAQGKLTAQMQWQHSENARLEAICAAHGHEVIHPQRDRGAQHLKTDAYKAQQELNAILMERSAVLAGLQQLSALNLYDLFQWAEDKCNRQSTTVLELYCQERGLDYQPLVDALGVVPNEYGHYYAGSSYQQERE